MNQKPKEERKKERKKEATSNLSTKLFFLFASSCLLPIIFLLLFSFSLAVRNEGHCQIHEGRHL
tara:strand:- start:221 stop:412 length:192 start_codon:yes stop_codon:yes gene_type:complete